MVLVGMTVGGTVVLVGGTEKTTEGVGLSSHREKFMGRTSKPDPDPDPLPSPDPDPDPLPSPDPDLDPLPSPWS